MKLLNVTLLGMVGLVAVGCFDSPTDYGTPAGSAGAAGSAAGSAGSAGSDDAGAAGTSAGAGGAPNACASLPANQCSTIAQCYVAEAAPISGEPECSGPQQAVGCYDASRGCTAAVTTAFAPDGAKWVFNSGCFPAGWTPGSPSDVPEPCTGEGGSAGTAGSAN